MKRPTVSNLFIKVFLALYGLFLLWELFLGNYRTPESSINLIPFATIMRYIHYRNHFNFNLVLVNLAGNIAVFVPPGILVPAVFKSFGRFIRLFIVSILLISLIEFLQFVFRVGVCDVDDLILNVAGVTAGYGLYALGRAVFGRPGLKP